MFVRVFRMINKFWEVRHLDPARKRNAVTEADQAPEEGQIRFLVNTQTPNDRDNGQ